MEIKKQLVILDNYDSFTFNLVHYFESLELDVHVCRNDEIDWEIFDTADYIVLSPGPGLPKTTTNLFLVIEKYATKKPILGVCLGMQAIAEFYGGTIRNQEAVKHGKQEQLVQINSGKLLNGLPNKFKVGLYHSWEVVLADLPDNFIPLALSENGILMSFEDTQKGLFAVQFHPESILSEYGKELLKNFIDQ